MDLPFSIAIPEEYLKKGDQDDGETTRTPENTPKKTSEKRSASTSVMETQKKPKSASFIVFDSFSRLISIEKVQKCEFWKSAIIVGKREIVFCATVCFLILFFTKD